MNEQTAPPDESQPPPPEREGDPLDGLWHWTDHPAARFGIVMAILFAILILFPVLAQWTF